MTIKYSIHELTSCIRNKVNALPLHNELLCDKRNWYMLCSSLDVIEDTEMAILSYKHGDFNEDIGLNYLILYGLYQAMYLQQDAIGSLRKALKINGEISEAFNDIRETRNEIFGHPTSRKPGMDAIKRNSQKTGVKKLNTSHFIIRMQMSKEKIVTLNTTQVEGTSSKEINVIQQVDGQLVFVSDEMKIILKALTYKERQHIEKWRGESLSGLLDKSGYFMQNIFKGFHGDKEFQFAIVNVDLLYEKICKFEDSIAERNLTSDYTSEEIRKAKRRLSDLRSYFGYKSNLNEEQAEEIAGILSAQLEEISNYASDIDKSNGVLRPI